jgi:uncharacterized protein involved in outer membrane biogenesis
MAIVYLRSACEALIEENLFAKAVQRYDDQIRVQNLENAVFDTDLALRIVKLHGETSEKLMAHNRSAEQQEQPLVLADYVALRKVFNTLEADLSAAKNSARIARESRDEQAKAKTWP